MSKVKVENSAVLQKASSEVGAIKDNMSANLSEIVSTFLVAKLRWTDKNAQICSSVLEMHNAAMGETFSHLGEIEGALRLLGNLAKKYEDI